MLDRFLEGPGRTSPPVQIGFKSIFYLLRDIIWLNIISVPLLFRAILKFFFPVPEKDLNGKVVLITGAGRGLGRELAIQFTRLGSKVICVDINEPECQETLRHIASRAGDSSFARAIQCDVSNPEATNTLATTCSHLYKNVDIIINNAGIIQMGKIDELSSKAVQKIVDVNLMSNFWMFRSFLPMMKQQKTAHFVATVSYTAVHNLGDATAYSASKAGLMGLLHALDEELRNTPETKHIILTGIYPYFVRSSPNFMNDFIVRLPYLELEDAVRQMMVGIRREYFNVSIPGPYSMFTLMYLIKALPIEYYRRIKDTFYAKCLEKI